MSNYNNIFEKIDSSPDITPITNNITQMNLEDNNLQDLSFLNEMVKECVIFIMKNDLKPKILVQFLKR
jgi:hypothetical protein